MVLGRMRRAICLSLIVTGCVSCKSEDGDSKDAVGMLRPTLIAFAPMYSAYDGVHEFKLTPSVPSAAADSKDTDPVDGSTLMWNVDESFVKKESFSGIPGAIMLTTKKPGTTIVGVTAKTRGGLVVRGSSKLTISKAEPGEWQLGDARYNNGVAIDWESMYDESSWDMAPGAGQGVCGLPFDAFAGVPKNSACGNCHNTMDGLTVEHTPTQTAGYADDELIAIFTQGMKPKGGTYNSAFLLGLPKPDCIYMTFHQWKEIDEPTKRGIVWKLRSLTPKPQAEVDWERLADDEGWGAPEGAGGGAAGQPAP